MKKAGMTLGFHRLPGRSEKCDRLALMHAGVLLEQNRSRRPAGITRRWKKPSSRAFGKRTRRLPMTPLPSEAIAVSRLEKRFGDFVAVDRITFRVKKEKSSGFSARTAPANPPPSACAASSRRPRAKARGRLRPGAPAGKHQTVHRLHVPEIFLYEDLTPYENVRFYLGVYSVPRDQWPERIDWILNMTRLKDVRDRLTRESRRRGGVSGWPRLRAFAPAANFVFR